jgi:serine/threonine protein phosphatase PrpC
LQRDEFFILACDGLWRVFDNSQAVDFVSKHVQKQKQDDEGGVARDNADAAMALVREAIRGRQALDNVSAVVVMLGW